MSTPSAIDITDVSAVAKSSRPSVVPTASVRPDETGGPGHEQPEAREERELRGGAVPEARDPEHDGRHREGADEAAHRRADQHRGRSTVRRMPPAAPAASSRTSTGARRSAGSCPRRRAARRPMRRSTRGSGRVPRATRSSSYSTPTTVPAARMPNVSSASWTSPNTRRDAPATICPVASSTVPVVSTPPGRNVASGAISSRIGSPTRRTGR